MSDNIAEAARELAPRGRLRAAINLGNPVLAQRGADGEPTGVSVDLARELARRLAVPLDIVLFDAAGKVFEALGQDAWDVAFLAIDPARAQRIEFTAPYVIIEGGYVVPSASPFHDVADVDRPGVRVAVARGSAYDLFLSRAMRHAQIVRCADGVAAFEQFRRDGLEALAGVKSPLARLVEQHAGLRVLPGRFMVIEQAMGNPKGRVSGARYLDSFVEEMKASGIVAASLVRSGQQEAKVASSA